MVIKLVPYACFARSLASCVLPTPVGPINKKEPTGRSGSLRPAAERLTASHNLDKAAS